MKRILTPSDKRAAWKDMRSLCASSMQDWIRSLHSWPRNSFNAERIKACKAIKRAVMETKPPPA